MPVARIVGWMIFQIWQFWQICVAARDQIRVAQQLGIRIVSDRGLRLSLANFSEAVGFRLLVQISLSPWSDGQSGRLVQSSEVLSLLPLSAAGCGGYPVLVVLLRSFPVLVDSGDRIL